MTALQEHFDVAIPTTPAPQKTYVGRREPAAGRSHLVRVTVLEAGKERPLTPVREGDHFDWGYRGEGPAWLASAVLADHLGYVPPPRLIFQFVVTVVALFRREGWTLPASDVATWLGRNLTKGRG